MQRGRRLGMLHKTTKERLILIYPLMVRSYGRLGGTVWLRQERSWNEGGKL